MTPNPAQICREPVFNHLVLAVLPTPWGRWLLPGLTALRFAGRRSGRLITLPVTYASTGTDVIVLIGRSATKRWWRNFRGGLAVDVLIDGRWRVGVGEVVPPARLEYPRLYAAYRRVHGSVPLEADDPIVHITFPSVPRADAGAPVTAGPRAGDMAV